MNASLFSRIGRGHASQLLAALMIGSLPACTNIERQSPATEAAAVAPKQAANVVAESALTSQLEGLDRQIASRKEYNAKLGELVATKEQQLATVLATDRSAGPTVQEFELRTSVNSKAGQMERAARAWQETIEAHRRVLAAAGSDPRASELTTEIDRLAAERAELLRLRARLLAINDKLKQ
jgi:hypothetical protein